MDIDTVEDIVIVGAGLAGLATALGLHRRGIKSLVLEASPTMRTTGFAFTIWTNAWRAMDALGVGDKVRAHHLLMDGITSRSATSGEISTKIDLVGAQGKRIHELRCVRRDFLLKTLAAELPEGTIKYSSKVVLIEEHGDLKLLHLADGSKIRTKVLIGSDGINSVVARYLGLGKPVSSGRWATRGLAEYPAGHGFKRELLQINGSGFRTGSIPCSDERVYWYFTWSHPENGAEKLVDESNKQKMREFVVRNLVRSKAPEEMIEAIERSEMGEVVSFPLRCRSSTSLLSRSFARRNICVIGDALHPMTPDLGQGGCICLEDGVVLSRHLADAVSARKVEDAMEKFAKDRRWRCANVAAGSYIAGLVLGSSNWFVKLLREMFLDDIITRALLHVSDYDCGGV